MTPLCSQHPLGENKWHSAVLFIKQGRHSTNFLVAIEAHELLLPWQRHEAIMYICRCWWCAKRGATFGGLMYRFIPFSDVVIQFLLFTYHPCNIKSNIIITQNIQEEWFNALNHHLPNITKDPHLPGRWWFNQSKTKVPNLVFRKIKRTGERGMISLCIFSWSQAKGEKNGKKSLIFPTKKAL